MVADLEQYVAHANDATLTKWWARYCESVGDFDKALQGYALNPIPLTLYPKP
jgi:hypothetical protein